MITSVSNPQMKQISMMLKKPKARNEAGAYVVEGIRMVSEVPEDDLIQVYVSASFLNSHKQWADKALCISDKIYKEISDTATPQGIMATVKQKKYDLEHLLEHQWVKPPLLLILESIQDPGNLGTMIRMAEGAGADGIIMDKSTVDIYNPKVVRSTMGSVFRVPFLYVDDLEEVASQLQGSGMKLYAAHLKGSQYYFEESYLESTGILIGNEAAGLSDSLANLADVHIKIPMDGQVESLNAAMAATILMYEVKRQRLSEE